jgi:nucleotide-binding universal stress UspA family protein
MRRADRSAFTTENEKGRRPVNSMTSVKRLLLATDFSDWARRAEDYARALAASWRATLTVITVLEFPPGMNPEYTVNKQYLTDRMSDASARLAEFKQRAYVRGIATTTRIATGMPSEEIIAAALAEEADMVIVGTRGKSGLAHVLLGSTAERVIRMAPCPVLAVHTAIGESLTEKGICLDRILVPTDFSECSEGAVTFAGVVAAQAKASIELLHVVEPGYYSIDFTIEHPDEREQKRQRSADHLEALSEKLSKAGIAVNMNLRGGAPADMILDVAKTTSSDLILMGTHGRRGVSHMWAGSVTESVLRRGTIPVLAVRNPAFSRRLSGD